MFGFVIRSHQIETNTTEERFPTDNPKGTFCISLLEAVKPRALPNGGSQNETPAELFMVD